MPPGSSTPAEPAELNLPAPRSSAEAERTAELETLRAQVLELEAQLAICEHEQARARAREAELEQVVESLPQIVWIARPDGWHTYFNQQWLEFTGRSLEESLGHGWNPPFHPEDRARAAARWRQATESGEPYEIEYRLRCWNGNYHWMLGRAMPMRNEAGEIVKWFGTCTDIEELKQTQARAGEQARLLGLTQDAILVEDLQGQITYWNSACSQIFGYSAEEALGKSALTLLRPDTVESEQAHHTVAAEGEWRGELHCQNRGGQELIMEARWTLVCDEEGEPQGVLAVHTDATERRATEAAFIQMLEQEATRDPLTGLPNRALLAERLSQHLENLEEGEKALSVLFIDLDAFKDINDSQGHLLGDQVLTEVARRLSANVRPGDTVARFGGDEFVILLPHTGAEQTDEIAGALLSAVREPMEFEGRRFQISASIGIAMSPPLAPEDLLRSADAAVYHAKAQGRDQVRQFVGDLSSQAEERFTLSSELRDAVHNDALHLVYQPIMSLISGEVIGIEALARWEHPERGMIAPDVFVALAERIGLSRELDAWVLRRACSEFSRLREKGGLSLEVYLAVNITAANAAEAEFPSVVEAALNNSGVPASALVVEVTETSLMADLDAGAATLRALHAMGVRIAIDDFGTGWSSLTYLKRLPTSIIKLDRSFVARLPEDAQDRAIAAAVIGLGAATGANVVAEGVETLEQLRELEKLNCPSGQGWLWHQGVHAEEVAASVKESQARHARTRK